jgi:hypothetical protein
MGMHRPHHLCSFLCSSHVQPTFEALLQVAEDSVQSLFSSREALLRSIQDPKSAYPTKDQLFHARVVGLTQFRLYFSNLLLSKEDKARVSFLIFPLNHLREIHINLTSFANFLQHSRLTRLGLTEARVKLVNQTKSKLIWNYLPVDVAQRAAIKLKLAMETCECNFASTHVLNVKKAPICIF